MVRKLIVVVVFMALNTGALANTEVVVKDTLTYPVIRSIPWDTVVAKYRRLAEVSQECFVIVEKGVRDDGPKVYFQKHKDVFFPIAAFLVLYLVWLRKRARD
jgi:hypothetical protein